MKKYDYIHFGVDYYPEHWPRERWDLDADLMQKMGVQVVRMAEFSWHKMEPSEGTFDFKWLDEIIEIMDSHGIKTVLGTPTAAPPAWLANKYPEILPVDRMGIVHGFGGRHHDCQSNKVYREKVRIIVTEMAKHYCNNPGVIGWQPDNELGNSHDDLCTCDSCRKAFQIWLEKKYSNVDRLNEAWGTAFWSQEYNSFSEVFAPRITVAGENPSQMLDWRCFHSDLIIDFFKWQADIIRKFCPDHFITHNYMGFADTVDYYGLSELVDWASHDQYPSGFWNQDGMCPPHVLAAQLDGIRSYKKKPFWIMEQQAGITGWGEMGRLPEPGQISMWSLQSIAHGADAIVYFRWRTCAMGTEQYWHGILPHSGIPGRTYAELTDMVNKMRPVMEEIKGSMPANKAAIVFSFRQNYALRTQKQSRYLEYIDQIYKYYKAFYDSNVSVDFVSDDDDISEYSLVVAPLQYLMTPELENKYIQYVENGGTLLLTMRTGVKNADNICMTDMPLPGKLATITGCTISEYDALYGAKINVKTDVPGKYEATVWADLLDCAEDTEVLAVYDDDIFYKGVPVITKHPYGEGFCFYVGTEPDENLMKYVIGKAVRTAKADVSHNADSGIEITSRVGNGHEYTFIINHTGKTGHYDGVEGTLIYGETKGLINPHGVHIVKK